MPLPIECSAATTSEFHPTLFSPVEHVGVDHAVPELLQRETVSQLESTVGNALHGRSLAEIKEEPRRPFTSADDIATDFELRRYATIVAAFEGALQNAMEMSQRRDPLGLMRGHIQNFLHPELLANDPLVLDKIVRTLLRTRCTNNSVFSVLADIQETDVFKDADRFSMKQRNRLMVQKLDLGRLREAGLLVDDRYGQYPPDLIGAGWKAGRLEVTGDVGRSAGQHMTGGELVIKGRAGHSLGEKMHGGSIQAFEAQDRPGTAMDGGEIIVMQLLDGLASVGMEMRDGSISIYSASGTVRCGEGMTGGTIKIANAGTVIIGAHCAGQVILIDCQGELNGALSRREGCKLRVVSTEKRRGLLRNFFQV